LIFTSHLIARYKCSSVSSLPSPLLFSSVSSSLSSIFSNFSSQACSIVFTSLTGVQGIPPGAFDSNTGIRSSLRARPVRMFFRSLFRKRFASGPHRHCVFLFHNSFPPKRSSIRYLSLPTAPGLSPFFEISVSPIRSRDAFCGGMIPLLNSAIVLLPLHRSRAASGEKRLCFCRNSRRTVHFGSLAVRKCPRGIW